MLPRLKRIALAMENSLFDPLNRVDTGGFFKSDRTVSDSPYRLQGSGYQAVLTDKIRTLIREGLRHAHPRAFIDLGCGKGKACLYAWKTGAFESITGIDYDARLIEVAERNDKGRGIVFFHADAADYRVPPLQCLVFLYNPFDAAVLRMVLENNVETLRRTGSLIAYANDIHRPVLEEFGLRCLYRDGAKELSLWIAG
jgi:SAM-dependent methyltransferase